MLGDDEGEDGGAVRECFLLILSAHIRVKSDKHKPPNNKKWPKVSSRK